MCHSIDKDNLERNYTKNVENDIKEKINLTEKGRKEEQKQMVQTMMTLHFCQKISTKITQTESQLAKLIYIPFVVISYC